MQLTTKSFKMFNFQFGPRPSQNPNLKVYIYIFQSITEKTADLERSHGGSISINFSLFSMFCLNFLYTSICCLIFPLKIFSYGMFGFSFSFRISHSYMLHVFNTFTLIFFWKIVWNFNHLGFHSEYFTFFFCSYLIVDW